MGTPRFTPEFKEEAVRQISSITLKCSTTGPGATVISAASVRGPSNRPRREDRICLQAWGQANVAN
jgi:transposase-like protein